MPDRELEPWAVAIEGDRPPRFIEATKEVAVTVQAEAPVRVVIMAQQGPRGPRGLPASAGGGSPEMTYAGGVLSRVDYADGTYKLFEYVTGTLLHVDFVTPTATVRKTFFYNPDGSLDHITEAEL